jgi:phytoene dehydrogenase-like protein
MHTDLGPDSAAGAMFGWLLCALGQQVGFPTPEGGAARLTSALVDRLVARGGRVECDAEVEQVIVRDGRAVAVRIADGREVDARRAVLADVDAPRLFLTLVGEDHLPARVLGDLRLFQWDHATVKVDWALDGPIPWEAKEARRAGTVHVADSMDVLTDAAAALASGRVPARPYLVMGQYSMVDPSRQPDGTETAWAYTHVPQTPRGDVAGRITGAWTEPELEDFVTRVEAEIERLAPGFRDLMRSRHVFHPTNMAAADANLHKGAVNSGTAQLHQQLVFRPTVGRGRPETPVKGLYLASASAHPGGGVHGGCGAIAARAAISATRRRRVVRRDA